MCLTLMNVVSECTR